MTRHQRNCTAGTVYTYHERQKDAAQSGYGTNKTRLGKDSVGDFDCCCLTLQPCSNPVITEEGFLYDKEAIIEYVLKQRQDYERKMKEYHRQSRLQEEEESRAKKSAKDEKVKTFIEKERCITSKPLNPFTEAPPAKRVKVDDSRSETASAITSTSTRSNGTLSSKKDDATENGDKQDKKSELPSFWIPSLTPQAKASAVQKPDKTIHCPMSKKPLKVKNLISVNFVRADDVNDKRPMVAKEIRYKCAVTHDILSNKTPCAVLRPSGKVVTLDCVEKIIKKDMRDPFTGDTLKDSDIIKIRRGGTGFASAAEETLEAKKARPVMMAS